MVQRGLIILFLIVIIAPLLALIMHGFSQQSDIFTFLAKNVLPDYIVNSLIILICVGITTIIIGVGCAWLCTQYMFPFVRLFEWLLLLPLAFPAYIVAYAYTDFLDIAGPVASGLNFIFPSIPSYEIMPQIRTIWGAVFVLSLCLYPYIYLFARTAFVKQSAQQNQIDAARLSGLGAIAQFFTLILPYARPYIIVGVTLVMMEVLADYGTVSYFGIKVFSTGIYNAWAGYGDSVAAARLSLILLLFVFTIVIFERYSRAKMRFFSLATEKYHPMQKRRLNPVKSVIAMGLCFIPVCLGFIIPVAILISLSMTQWVNQGMSVMISNIMPLLYNTLFLGGIVGVIMIILAYFCAALLRDSNNRFLNNIIRLSTFGYALPGIVLGLGLLLCAGWLSNNLPIVASGSILFLMVGYMIRFWTIPLQGIEAGFDKISPNIDYATAMMRRNRLSEFWHVRLPLLKMAFLSSFLMVFVDIIKELPLTLMLRPFDYDTMAVRAYNLAADERLVEAAFPSLIITLAGIIPVIILARLMRR